MKLSEHLECVHDEQAFLVFVKALIADREEESDQPVDHFGRGINDWENHSIETFLEAACAWANDSNFGKNQALKGQSPWLIFATFLYCGKIYE